MTDRAVALIAFAEDFEKFDCEKCRKYEHFAERGCDGAIVPAPCGKSIDDFIAGDVRLTYCPKILAFDIEALFLVELFEFYEHGNLYASGGIIDQPYWYIVAMKNISNKVNKWRNNTISKP